MASRSLYDFTGGTASECLIETSGRDVGRREKRCCSYTHKQKHLSVAFVSEILSRTLTVSAPCYASPRTVSSLEHKVNSCKRTTVIGVKCFHLYLFRRPALRLKRDGAGRLTQTRVSARVTLYPHAVTSMVQKQY